MVGTGAVIATARHISAVMMMTEEIDIYAEDAADIALVPDLIDGSIGRSSLVHKTFGYYGDGVQPEYGRHAAGLAKPCCRMRNGRWPRQRGLPERQRHRHRQTDRLAREGSGLATGSNPLRHCQG
jgi:hypothetical protein